MSVSQNSKIQMEEYAIILSMSISFCLSPLVLESFAGFYFLHTKPEDPVLCLKGIKEKCISLISGKEFKKYQTVPFFASFEYRDV